MEFIKGILRLSDLFDGVSDDQLKMLLPFCREEDYGAGTTIFTEGTPCQTIYIVESGSVALEMSLPISRRGGKGLATIGMITRGGCLGRSGLISPYTHCLTARAVERTEVIAIDAIKIRRWGEDDHEAGCQLMKNVAKVVASRLEHTKTTLGHILSIVLHDVKAPLASVESVNRLIIGGFCGDLDKEQKSMLQSSSKGITDLLNLLNNIASVSRIGIRGKVVSKISLIELITDAVDGMHPLAEEKGLELKAEVAEELPKICGDGAQIKQVLINLLSNAIKFTPPGGVVTVKAKDDNEYIRVEVNDTGIGIPADELPKIFDEFYRGLDLTERGAGLGLSIARGIVEGHGGKIWATSPCPGSDKGSQFVVTLPKDLGKCEIGRALVGANRAQGKQINST